MFCIKWHAPSNCPQESLYTAVVAVMNSLQGSVLLWCDFDLGGHLKMSSKTPTVYVVLHKCQVYKKCNNALIHILINT